LEGLDEHCIKILLVLLDSQQAHFNELYRLISKRSKKFSKPTLSKHLNHLQEAGFVTRTPDKGQLVTYSLNREKIGKMKEYSERVKRIVKSEYENEKEFFSLPENEQMNIVQALLVYRKLGELQALIDYELEPESFEKWFLVRFWANHMLERPFYWISKKCVEDEPYRNKILKIISESLEKLEK